jgi:hypothetical protein
MIGGREIRRCVKLAGRKDRPRSEHSSATRIVDGAYEAIQTAFFSTHDFHLRFARLSRFLKYLVGNLIGPTLGEHRHWSQNGHKTGATVPS